MRVLVVEDDENLAASLTRGLVAEGFAVDRVGDGQDALWLAQENDYDVIVVDVMIPMIDGVEVCRRLRAGGTWTPILVLTALDGAADEARALDTGADDFLAKPFAYEVLLARLRALMRRGARERPAVFTVGDVRVDPARHEVFRGDVRVELSPRQFSLVEFFARRAGEVVSKTEILEHVWDSAYDGDVNIVEVYVGQLRRKLDTPFGRHTITTVRGVGYRWEPDGA